MDVEIVELVSGRRCSPDQIGEIWVAGPSVAMGYWKRPQETEQVFKVELAEAGEHRFLRTGDLGFKRDGYLFITGRLKELIIIRGRNYYPQDIERTARESCPAVRLGTGAAFSVSAQTGERMVLVQEVPRRQKVDADQIFRSIREAIAEEHEVQIAAARALGRLCAFSESARASEILDLVERSGASDLVATTVRVSDEAPAPIATLVASEGSPRESLAWAYAQQSVRQMSSLPRTPQPDVAEVFEPDDSGNYRPRDSRMH